MLRICCTSSCCEKALLRQPACLQRFLLRQFERAAHADPRQRLHLRPLGRLAGADAAFPRQRVFQLGQGFAGAPVDGFAPRARFGNAPVQFDLARAQGQVAFGIDQRRLAPFERLGLARFQAAQAQARFPFFAPDLVPLPFVVEFLELARMLHLDAAFVGGQPQGPDAGTVGIELVVAQGQGLHGRHAEAIAGQLQAQRALQAFVELLPQCAVGRHLAQRLAADEFGGKLAHAGRQ
ncbi:hypothetical protein [Massilia sp. Dwa41.01b]|uniref:hypothetical protein n=1 Tax=Massilia sp. Dwa41.01b TaxID=2709302 RepID=UPI001E5DD61C|nr:hypothetical protein [Massilia sp. Dwa41.01b]